MTAKALGWVLVSYKVEPEEINIPAPASFPLAGRLVNFAQRMGNSAGLNSLKCVDLTSTDRLSTNPGFVLMRK
jgi:hypothetical protein